MTSPKLGKLVTLKATDVWGTEPQGFTPWLALEENLLLLATALQIEKLELRGIEVPTGDFRLDILAEDIFRLPSRPVIIENQFGPTDHKHLGQLISYVARERKQATVCWIAERFKEDHRAAIDWLNVSTSDDFDFFGIELGAVRIDNSAPAPVFKVVAKPNIWTRSSSSESGNGKIIPNKTDLLYQEYWFALRELYQQQEDFTHRFPKPLPRQWLPFAVGRSGFQLTATLSISAARVRVELYMTQKGLLPKEAFQKLERQKDDVEAEIGYKLDWQELPDSVASRIAIDLEKSNIQDKTDWMRQHKWILERLGEFRQIFSRRVRSLDLSIDGDDEELEGT